MKKLISFVLLASFMFTVLSACSGEPVTLLEFLPSNTNSGYNFGGATITTTDTWPPFYADPESTTLQSDRTRYRVAQVEKDLNVKFVTDLNCNSENASHYMTLYIANNLKYDLTVQRGTPNPIFDMYKAGILEPLEYMPFDLSDEEIYGTPKSRSSVTFGGLTYAHNHDNGDDGANRGFLVYNDSHVKSFGVADPQELYEQGKWTFDTFAEMLPLVSDMSNPDRPIYALALYNDPQMLPFSAVFANGGQVVKQNENGKYVFSLEDREAVDALEWVADLHATSDIFQESWPPHLFRDGQATFYLFRTFQINGFLDPEQSDVREFYFVPFPCGPNGEYGVNLGTYASEEGGVAFFNHTDTEMVGIVYDYFLRFDDYPSNLKFDKAAYDMENRFWSEKSYENYLKGFELHEYDYFYQIGSELYWEFANALYDATVGTSNFSTVMGSYADLIQAALDESLNS